MKSERKASPGWLWAGGREPRHGLVVPERKRGDNAEAQNDAGTGGAVSKGWGAGIDRQASDTSDNQRHR